ncbi:MAG: 3-hydroxyacyl-ACP dehydratase FabZ [Thermodesulfovibrionales bacterium]|nr:3-hydroxyacyl-ACP dehydratase FabZ [Thermodesulfovibrionales bacterium]
MSMDIKEICDVIPHRYPMLLVDRIEELVEGERVVALKNLTMNEAFFQGHFPGNPVMPGVLIVEAMAQAAGVLAVKTEAEGEKLFTYFMSIEKAKFRKPVFPGDQLRMEINVLQRRRHVWKVEGKAYVEDNLVAEAQITAMLSDKEI